MLSTPLAYAGGEGALSELANTWATAYKNDVKIKPIIGTHCGGCQFKAKPDDGFKSGFHECWKEANNWSDADFEGGTILEVWNFRKKQQLIDQGIYKISQISRHDIGDFDDEADITGLNRAQRQWLQIGGIPTEYDAARYYLDKSFMQVEMSKWQYPYHMIDFETSTVALPFYAGMRPYEAIAFQF